MLSLTVLSITANTASAAEKQLKEIFGGMVEINSIFLDDLESGLEIPWW